MKILFFVHALTSGGAERVLATLANHFAERGDEIVISCDTSISSVYSLNNKIKLFDHRKNANKGFLRKRFSIFRLLKTFCNMRSITDSFKPDVAISFLTTFNVYTILALLGKHVPVVVCEHTTVSFKPILHERLCRDFLYRYATAITVLTSHDYNLWKDKYHQVFVMPNPCESLNTLPVSLNKDKVVLAVGRVTDWHLKGFDNLILSWCSICADYPEWSLKIAGMVNKESLSYLDALIKKYNGKRVSFLGFRKDIYELMNKSEVFVLSSRREGLPMGLIEAMSVGCCCVSFDVVTGPADIITNEVDGLLVKNQDVSDLSAKLRMVIEDEKLRKKLQKNAPNGVEKFGVWNVISKWDELFHKINILKQ